VTFVQMQMRGVVMFVAAFAAVPAKMSLADMGATGWAKIEDSMKVDTDWLIAEDKRTANMGKTNDGVPSSFAQTAGQGEKHQVEASNSVQEFASKMQAKENAFLEKVRAMGLKVSNKMPTKPVHASSFVESDAKRYHARDSDDIEEAKADQTMRDLERKLRDQAAEFTREAETGHHTVFNPASFLQTGEAAKYMPTKDDLELSEKRALEASSDLDDIGQRLHKDMQKQKDAEKAIKESMNKQPSSFLQTDDDVQDTNNLPSISSDFHHLDDTREDLRKLDQGVRDEITKFAAGAKKAKQLEASIKAGHHHHHMRKDD